MLKPTLCFSPLESCIQRQVGEKLLFSWLLVGSSMKAVPLHSSPGVKHIEQTPECQKVLLVGPLQHATGLLPTALQNPTPITKLLHVDIQHTATEKQALP